MLGRIKSVTLTNTSQGSQNIITDRLYRADGLLLSQTFGNGLQESRIHDLQGRLTDQFLGNVDTRIYEYDFNGNVKGIQSLPQVAEYGYDALDRLIGDAITSVPVSSITFTYDDNGNRETANNTTYTYASQTNRLTHINGSAITFGPAGHLTNLGSTTLTWNGAGQLVTLTMPSGTVQYRYNPEGLRSRKTAGTNSILFHYDPSGNLIAETTATGALIRAYIWDDNVPIAQIDASGILYLHTDHIGTPRVATNSSQTKVWNWEGSAFGNTPPTGSATINLRFPGQYWDQESNLIYNGARYYSAELGRYISSDPIGLGGGMNTYTYSFNNPLKFIDPTGLDAVAIVFPDYPVDTGTFGRARGLGHGGILLIDPSGKTEYYEYGRYSSGDSCECGAVRSRTVPNVVMGRDGRPTPASLNRTLRSISRQAGQGGRISGAYIPNDQFGAMSAAARQRMGQNRDPNRTPYSPMSNNCMTFVKEILEAGDVDTPWMIDPRPNSYIEELRDNFTPVDFR